MKVPSVRAPNTEQVRSSARYDEAIGFIGRVEEPDDIDFFYFVTAHEFAHQWWGHQLIGGGRIAICVPTAIAISCQTAFLCGFSCSLLLACVFHKIRVRQDDVSSIAI